MNLAQEQREAIFDLMDTFVEKFVEMEADTASEIEGVLGTTDLTKEQVIDAIRQSGAADNLTRCVGAGALESLAREAVWRQEQERRLSPPHR